MGIPLQKGIKTRLMGLYQSIDKTRYAVNPYWTRQLFAA